MKKEKNTPVIYEEEYEEERAPKRKNKTLRATKKFLAILLALGITGYTVKTCYEVGHSNAVGNDIVTRFEQSNQGLINKYDEYVQAVALSMRSLMGGEINPLQAYSLYNILQSNGYLSCNQSFTYNLPVMFEAPGSLGISVPLGSATPTNTVCNLNEIMKALGFDSTVQLGYVFDKFDRQKDTILVAVNYAGVTYLFDPYNHHVYLKDAIITFRAVDNGDIRFIPSELMDKKYGPELTADTIAPLHKFQPDDYKNYSGAVKTYIDPSLGNYPKLTRTNIENAYFTSIYPATQRLVDELLTNYYVDNNTINAYFTGQTGWPTSYLARTETGIISTSFIDEQEAATLK